MPIQVNDINVIDDSRNFSAAGIVTVGTGNSATIIDGTTGITSVGIGITIEGVPGNISIAGTITAAAVNFPLEAVGFNPANGEGNVVINIPEIAVYLSSSTISVGSTGFIYLRGGSAGGTTLDTFGVDDVTILNGGIFISPTTNLPEGQTIFPVIEEGFIQNFIGLNTTGGDSYSFFTALPALGSSYGGGYLFCAAGGTAWIVAPSGTQRGTNWANRGQAVSAANASAPCGDWFVPAIAELESGYSCRTYWDSYNANSCYWSNTSGNPYTLARRVYFFNGFSGFTYKTDSLCVRAFRCVSY